MANGQGRSSAGRCVLSAPGPGPASMLFKTQSPQEAALAASQTHLTTQRTSGKRNKHGEPMTNLLSTETALKVGGVDLLFDYMSLNEAIQHLSSEAPLGWNVVVTPNIHLLRLMHEDPEVAALYSRASLVLADGWPVAAMLTMMTRRPVDRVTGADLLERLIRTPGYGRPLVVIGGSGETVLSTLSAIATSNGWVVKTNPAPVDLIDDPERRGHLVSFAAREGAGGVVVLGLGAPRQEILADELREQAGSGWILCVGMAVNFSGGGMQRAPGIFRAVGLEWFHRMVSEPRRLGPRYARDARAFFHVAVQNLRRQR
jgi:exopolysaccharide biosynthesis WecB/TagA/CpsF family protein